MIKNSNEEKARFFIKEKFILCFWGIISLILIALYLVTLDMPPVLNLTLEMANSIWNIIISLSTGYLISLIFYIMLVFESEYSEYKKRNNISKRVYKYYLRMNTYITEILYIIVENSNFNSIDDIINSDIECENIKNTIEPLEEELKKCAIEVDKNLHKIEPYLIYINDYAVNLFIEIQETFIFENINNEYFILAISSYLNKLVKVKSKLDVVNEEGHTYLI